MMYQTRDLPEESFDWARRDSRAFPIRLALIPNAAGPRNLSMSAIVRVFQQLRLITTITLK
jgi:hypothetical protein